MSSMYPSKKYKYYGVYVKNVKDILDSKYEVETVVDEVFSQFCVGK